MAVSTTVRDTKQLCSGSNVIDIVALPVAAGVSIPAGCLVAVLNTGLGAVNALGATATHVLIGKAEESVDNTTGALGAKMVRVRCGVFVFDFNGATQPYPGQKVFVLDNQTFTLTAAANGANAGVCIRTGASALSSDVPAGAIAVHVGPLNFA